MRRSLFLFSLLTLSNLIFVNEAQAVGFKAARSLAVGANPKSVTIGDVNNDGKLDVVTASSISGTSDGVTVLLGNGNGTFQTRKDSDTTVQPTSVTLGDLNGDGKLDAIVTEQNNRLLVMLGNGDGTFQAPVTYATGAVPESAIVADLDGDGKADVAVATLNEATISILFGNGDGTLRPFIRVNAGPNPVSIAAADLNGDGRVDLAVANFNGNGVSILLNSSSTPGSFFLSTQPIAGTHANSIIAGDFNGDGRADLAVANEGDGTVSVFLGNGNGTFQPQVKYAAGTGAFSVTTTDLNGDGKADLLVDNFTGNNLSVLLGNGNGTFQPFVAYSVGGPPLVPISAPALATGDFNQDGIPDVVTVCQGNTLSYSLGAGDGSFPLSATAYTAGTAPQAVTLADLNGDGKVDLAIANATSDNVSILLANGDGTFTSTKSVLVQVQPSSITAADFNADGRMDLAVANRADNTVSIALGNGDGSFKAAVNYAFSSSETDFVASADVNEDGKIDLLVLHGTPIGTGTQGTVDILLGNGDGTFAIPTAFQVGAGPVALTIADFNGDHHLDIAVANSLNTVSSVLFGVGDGTFQPQTFTPPATGSANWIASGDLNGDGKPDLVVPSSCQITPSQFRGCLHLFLNNGFGFFNLTDLLLDSSVIGASQVTIADFNSDGKADLVVSHSGGISYLQGNGDGTFQTSKTFSVSGGAFAIAAADLNVDAAPDVVAVNGAFAYILLNTAGTAVQTTSSLNPSALQQNVTLTATVSPTLSGFGKPTGNVTFKEGATVLSTVTLDSSGKAGLTTSTLTLGSHVITAFYSGDADFNPHGAAPFTQVIKFASSTSLSSSAASVVLGNPITFKATVTGNSGPVTGSVVFMDGSTSLGSASLDGSGVAILTSSTLTGGNHTITAAYQGDGNYVGSTSGAVTEAIQDYALAVSPSSASVRAGQSATFTITANPLAGFNGQISFACSGLPALANCSFNPATVTANGAAATTTLTITTTGSSATVFSPFGRGGLPYIYAVLLGPLGFGVVLLRGRKRGAGLLLAVALVGFAVACGGGGNGGNNSPRPSTPAGSSTVTVTATSTISGTSVSHQLPVAVTVN